MSYNNFKNLQGMNFNFKPIDPLKDISDRIAKEREATLMSIQESKQERYEEELRRHNELVNTLKEAKENGATIVIGDNAKDIQIQQNSRNSSQTMTNSQTIDYEKIKNTLEEIKTYFNYPQFYEAYGDKSESIKSLIEEILSSIEKKDDERLIRKSLNILGGLAIGAGGSLIASGIHSLLMNLGVSI